MGDKFHFFKNFRLQQKYVDNVWHYLDYWKYFHLIMHLYQQKFFFPLKNLLINTHLFTRFKYLLMDFVFKKQIKKRGKL